MFDALGDRMKEYEHNSRHFLCKKQPVIIRVDGRAFHTFTKQFERPFDAEFTSLMNLATLRLLQEAQGSRLAFTQSDEISILLTDLEAVNTEAWFGNNLQKLCSLSSSIVTSEFTCEYVGLYLNKWKNNTPIKHLPTFDARAFSLPIHEVENYFIWRQNDCLRNSLQSYAQSKFSHKELEGKGRNEQIELLKASGFDWEKDIPLKLRQGRIFVRDVTEDGAWTIVPNEVDFKSKDGRDLFKVLLASPDYYKGITPPSWFINGE